MREAEGAQPLAELDADVPVLGRGARERLFLVIRELGRHAVGRHGRPLIVGVPEVDVERLDLLGQEEDCAAGRPHFFAFVVREALAPPLQQRELLFVETFRDRSPSISLTRIRRKGTPFVPIEGGLGYASTPHSRSGFATTSIFTRSAVE
jgi:hypothetical protein